MGLAEARGVSKHKHDQAHGAKHWIYRLDQLERVEKRCDTWDDVKALLGGKGANLAEMTKLGLPVPPGFIVTTKACNAYLAAGEKFPPSMWQQVLTALRRLEDQTGKGCGNPESPLLDAVYVERLSR